MLSGDLSRKALRKCRILPSQFRRVSQPFSTHSQLHHRSHPRSAKMSWMDSWSRPSKSQATPVPFYMLPGGEATPYCHSCGRVISNRRTTAKTNNTPVKYCSSRCRANKPGKLDRELERVFVQFLCAQEGDSADMGEGSKGGGAQSKQKKGKHAKGDARILVPCSVVEEYVFGSHQLSMEGAERESEDGTALAIPPDLPEAVSSGQDIELEESFQGDGGIDGHVLARMAVRSGTRVRPAQSVSEVNSSVGGEKGKAERFQETDAMAEKRKEGQKRAKEREMTKCAARRGVVFGFDVGQERRLCEAVMGGKVVEPSFAKGDWGIRWRE